MSNATLTHGRGLPDAREVESRIAGQWPQLFSAASGQSIDLFDGKNHACPKCGGKDRFRGIDVGNGKLYCNQCGKNTGAGGISNLMWLTDWQFQQALRFAADYAGMNPDVNEPKRDPAHNGTAKPKRTFGTWEAAGESYGLGKWSRADRYVTASGKLVGVVLRFDLPDGKTIRPASVTDAGRWVQGAMPEGSPAFNLPDVLSSDQPILWVEGEKCVEAAGWCGVTATTSAGGSNASAKTDYEPFRGKTVVIWPDPDAPGLQYRDDVTARLLAVGAKVRCIDPAAQGLTGKQDFFDWQEARDSTPTDDLTREIREIMLNAVEVVETPDKNAHGTDAVYETAISAAVERPFVDVDSVYIQFPLEVFPNSVRTYISESADAVGVDPAFVGVPALVGLAGAIGNTRRLKIKNSWSEPSILWAALVAHSGSGKSPALDLAMKPIEERQKRDHKSWKERHRQWADVDVPMYESAMKQAKGGSGQQGIEKPEEPIEVRTLVADITIESVGEKLQHQPRGLVCKRDELAGWLGSFTRYKSSGGSGDEPDRHP